MTYYCKNCVMECWKENTPDCKIFPDENSSGNCSLYIDKMNNKTIDELEEEENDNTDN